MSKRFDRNFLHIRFGIKGVNIVQEDGKRVDWTRIPYV